MVNHRKASRIFNKVLRFVLGKYLTGRYNLVHIDKGVKELKPPYLILANHTNFWDPFFVGTFVPEPIHFVTADEYFRNPLVKVALGLVGAIPKSKFIADFDTVKSILKIKKTGGIIGIFPEGKRNWDGGPEPIVYSTAKLIKALKIPVVTVLLKGAHLSKPRWARKSRRGTISVAFEILLTPEEIRLLPTDEIYKRITAGLAYDEYVFQKDKKIPFRGQRLAENLELFLFTCPQCRQIGTMKSRRNDFFCGSCGYCVSFDEYGFFQQKKNRSGQQLSFRSPREWNQWQLKLLEEEIVSVKEDTSVILEDRLAVMFRGTRLQPLKRLHTGHLQLLCDSLLFLSLHGDKLRFPLEEITGLNVQHNDKLEFYHQDTLYRFIFKPHVSAYKWTKGIELLHKRRKA